tara:strand:- start:323 stop:622 length:300 start_codon:yes stop_codon:yes gene_type:complete
MLTLSNHQRTTEVTKNNVAISERRLPMTNRTHKPCRECGEQHTNPMSSSICPTCGAVESERKATEAYDRETTEAEDKDQSFEDAETVHELKEWIRQYML